MNTYIHTITLHYITFTFAFTFTFTFTLHYTTLHYIPLHYITLHYLTLHYINTYMHTYIHTYIHTITLIHTYIHSCMQTHRQTNRHTYIYTYHYITLHCIALHYITLHYVSTCIHAYTHTYIHTYMHACMHAYIQKGDQPTRNGVLKNWPQLSDFQGQSLDILGWNSLDFWISDIHEMGQADTHLDSNDEHWPMPWWFLATILMTSACDIKIHKIHHVIIFFLTETAWVT